MTGTIGPVRLTLHIQPRARTTELAGPHGDAIKIRLQAPPVDDAANRELVDFLARTLGVSRSAVTITAGRSSRRKTVAITGITRAAAERALGVPLARGNP